MPILETLDVRVVHEKWDEKGSIFVNNISFDLGNSGLLLGFILDRPAHANNLVARLRALDLGAVVDIEIDDARGPFKCVFSHAVLTGKQALHTQDESPNPLSASIRKEQGYPGLVQLAFHVGPILERK